MAYSTFAEVAAEFKQQTFDATSNVTDTDVTNFIVEADALIDSYVGMKYSVPVTAGAGLNLLKMLSRNLVANRVKGILEVKQENARDANQNIRSGLSTPEILKILTNIRDGNLSLEGATSLIVAGGFYSYNYANDVKPVFEKDTKQW